MTNATMNKEQAIHYFWSKIEQIETMECVNLDQLCEKEVLIANIRKEIEALPEEIREAVENSKRPAKVA